MALLQIASNPVKAKLINADRDAKLIVSELLSYYVDGHEHTDAFTNGHWDGRSSFLDFRSGVFPAGFAGMVRKELASQGYQVQLVRKKPPAPLGPEHPQVDVFGDDPRYDYQRETVDRLTKHGAIIAQVATGGGKSRICKLAVARIRRPALFITTRGVLMYQMKDGFEEMGLPCGVLGDGDFRPKKGINVAMVQTLQARLKMGAPGSRQAMIREQTKKLLQVFELVIGEEAHEAGGGGYWDVLQHCKNAHYRLALTATPFMRSDAEANMRLMGAFGPVGIQISEKLLIDRGILATPYFKYVECPKPAKLYRTTSWQRAYKLGIVENEARNWSDVQDARTAASYGLTTMVLVQQKAHGKLLKDMMQQAGLRVRYIFGEHNQETRNQALAQLKAGEIDVLIGSTIMDVGVDVPAVGLVILAGGGKAEVALRQRIGRGLRAKKTGPNVCFVKDHTDPWNKHLRDHAATRRKIVESTPGFAENILREGADFPYAQLGFKQAA